MLSAVIPTPDTTTPTSSESTAATGGLAEEAETSAKYSEDSVAATTSTSSSDDSASLLAVDDQSTEFQKSSDQTEPTGGGEPAFPASIIFSQIDAGIESTNVARASMLSNDDSDVRKQSDTATIKVSFPTITLPDISTSERTSNNLLVNNPSLAENSGSSVVNNAAIGTNLPSTAVLIPASPTTSGLVKNTNSTDERAAAILLPGSGGRSLAESTTQVAASSHGGFTHESNAVLYRQSASGGGSGGPTGFDIAEFLTANSRANNVDPQSLAHIGLSSASGLDFAAIDFIRDHLAATSLLSDFIGSTVAAFQMTSVSGMAISSGGQSLSSVSDFEPRWIVTSSTNDATSATNAESNQSNAASLTGNQPDRRQWTRKQRSLGLADHESVAISPSVVMLPLAVVAAVSFFLKHILARGPPRGPPRSQIIESEGGNQRSCSNQLRRLRFSISPRGPSLVVRFARPVTLSASGPGRTLRTSALYFISTV